jgi:hypothetical protein
MLSSLQSSFKRKLRDNFSQHGHFRISSNRNKVLTLKRKLIILWLLLWGRAQVHMIVNFFFCNTTIAIERRDYKFKRKTFNSLQSLVKKKLATDFLFSQSRWINQLEYKIIKLLQDDFAKIGRFEIGFFHLDARFKNKAVITLISKFHQFRQFKSAE